MSKELGNLPPLSAPCPHSLNGAGPSPGLEEAWRRTEAKAWQEKVGNTVYEGSMQPHEFASPISMNWEPTNPENLRIATTALKVSASLNTQNCPRGHLRQLRKPPPGGATTRLPPTAQPRSSLAQFINLTIREPRISHGIQIGTPLMVSWLLCYNF